MINLLLLPLCLTLSAVSVAQAHEDCPVTIAVIEGSDTATNAADTLDLLYQELGCQTVFAEIPGRRGVLYFNSGKVDGEVFRREIIEPSYERAFIRSKIPLFLLSNSSWVHPDQELYSQLPYGYVLGIVWQEDYDGVSPKVGFKDFGTMYTAYNEGKLNGFLGPTQAIQTQIKSGGLSPSPQMKENLFDVPLYHYLGAEFKPFMARLSALLEKKNPFEVDPEN